MEIYIILVIMESFLQCNYLCTVQCCAYEQNKKDALWLILLSIQIYFLSFPPSSDLYFIFNKTMQPSWAAGACLGLVYGF